jgi:hypothetical protein
LRHPGIESRGRDAGTRREPDGQRVSFDVTVNIGSVPMEIRGWFIITPPHVGEPSTRLPGKIDSE